MTSLEGEAGAGLESGDGGSEEKWIQDVFGGGTDGVWNWVTWDTGGIVLLSAAGDEGLGPCLSSVGFGFMFAPPPQSIWRHIGPVVSPPCSEGWTESCSPCGF